MTRFPYSPPDDGPPDWIFGDVVHEIFPIGASSRLSRVLDVNQRLAQRWISGEQHPTQRAIAYVKQQEQALVRVGPTGELENLAERWSAAGMDNETIASHLAAIYARLTARQIE